MPAVAAKVDVIGSSAGKAINKFRVFNIAGESGLQARPPYYLFADFGLKMLR
jgi:hypothetical protein